MICWHWDNMEASCHEVGKRFNPYKPDCVVQGMNPKPVNQHSVIKGFLCRLISVYMQHPLRIMPEMLMPVNQFNRKKMIHMGMRNQQMLNLSKPQGITEGMRVCVWRKINQNLSIHNCLCSGAYLFPAGISCLSASFTFTKQGRQPLCCSSTQILYFHSVLLSSQPLTGSFI